MYTSSRDPDNLSVFLAGLRYHGVDLLKGERILRHRASNPAKKGA